LPGFRISRPAQAAPHPIQSGDTEREGQTSRAADKTRCDAMQQFVRQMAAMSLPEEETTGDLEEYLADLDEERLFGEYHTFMDMVRSAREIAPCP
jgi:hypothetical protein